jgi:hypothetical protein
MREVIGIEATFYVERLLLATMPGMFGLHQETCMKLFWTRSSSGELAQARASQKGIKVAKAHK